ncbi:efflux RND transporter periplasmic adaptor subunit [Flavihumibacter fluvii]|uniref:efflux RND transporter periplasmic adaptor subunit n=1 Tax=Flavihumibacter fluvii TaxID=2838157 RepID=UPI001BDE8C90|nr:HlyD family efflux transporter periplasmic adaptor subunit [Flavihumibacter fluvii]ULQ50838.1 efflux RND transporter periplasmic adaptor subunit [Flavihumibacter fluvii]
MRFHFIFGCILLISSSISSCRQKTEQTTVTEEKIIESAYASGTVKSRNQYQLYATVNGIIKEIFVSEGDTVKKGSPIMKIQNETARLTAENARIAADYANVSNNADRLLELQANIDFTRTKLKNDSSLYIRQKNLWEGGIGTRNDLETRELAMVNSRTNYESAILRYNELKRQLEFSAKQSSNNLQISAAQQSDFTIKSETNGKVYTILKEKGETVNLQSPVAIIGDARNFYLELQVDEYDISKIQLGQLVLLNLDSYKGQVYEAVIDKINPIMDERSRAFTIEASFTKQPPVLYPNLSAEANIIIRTKEKALTIPRNYLVSDSFVLTGKKEKKPVVTGIKDYQKVEIVSGLSAGETILKPVQ